MWDAVEEGVKQALLERGSADADAPNAIQQDALYLLEEGVWGNDKGALCVLLRCVFSSIVVQKDFFLSSLPPPFYLFPF